MTADDYSYYFAYAAWAARVVYYSLSPVLVPLMAWSAALAANLYLEGFWRMAQGRKMLLNAAQQGGWNESD
jgi:hypothetical protein